MRASSHLSKTSLLVKDVGVVELGLLSLAHGWGNAVVTLKRRPSGVGLLNLDAVLDVVLLNLAHAAARANKLSDNGELLAGVDGLASAVKVLVAHAEGVPVTSIGVTVASIASGRVGTSASIASTAVLTRRLARVRSIGHAHRVGLPDVHLGAARTSSTDTSVGVVGGRLPSLDVALLHSSAHHHSATTRKSTRATYQAVDELEVTRALAVAVACSVLGASSVGGVLGHATVGVHGNKVNGTVQAALYLFACQYFMMKLYSSYEGK